MKTTQQRQQRAVAVVVVAAAKRRWSKRGGNNVSDSSKTNHRFDVLYCWSLTLLLFLNSNTIFFANAFSSSSMSMMRTCPPIIEAAMTGNTRQVQRLLEQSKAGKDVDDVVNTLDDFQCTPLIWACTTGDHVETVQVLLQNGANVNHQEQLGQTALWRASLCGHYNVCRLLLQEPHFADATIADVNGVVPSKVADGKCRTLIDWDSFMVKNKQQPQGEERVVDVVSAAADKTSSTIQKCVDPDDDTSEAAAAAATMTTTLSTTDVIQQILQLKDEMQQQQVTLMTLHQEHGSTREKLESLLLDTLVQKKKKDDSGGDEHDDDDSSSVLALTRRLQQEENEALRKALTESQDEQKELKDKIRRFLATLL
jgi:Ankyrin repeats (3 copies)